MFISFVLTVIIGSIIRYLVLKYTKKDKLSEIILFSNLSRTKSIILMIVIAIIFIGIYIGISFILYGPNGIISPHHF